MRHRAYRELIRAQLKGFTQYAPIKEGDYAVVLDSPEKNFKETEVVKIEKVVGEFSFVRKFNRSKVGWVHTDNLEKIKMVVLSKDEGDESNKIPVRVEEVTTLRDFSPKLFSYFGRRIKQIFSEKMTEAGKQGEPLPIINPKIVIGEFIGEMSKVEGFVSKWGEDSGTIFVNAKSNFPVDEVVSHEFSHVLSFYSLELAKKLEDPSIQLGITEEEMDEKAQIEKGMREMEEWRKLGLDPHEIEKIKNQNYFLQPAEVFAHTEQMLYLVHKMKGLDLQHVKLDDSMSPEEKSRAAQEIEARPLKYYKRRVMNRLVPYMADKYKIKDFTARKIYESLFDNIETYIPNVPK